MESNAHTRSSYVSVINVTGLGSAMRNLHRIIPRIIPRRLTISTWNKLQFSTNCEHRSSRKGQDSGGASKMLIDNEWDRMKFLNRNGRLTRLCRKSTNYIKILQEFLEELRSERLTQGTSQQLDGDTTPRCNLAWVDTDDVIFPDDQSQGSHVSLQTSKVDKEENGQQLQSDLRELESAVEMLDQASDSEDEKHQPVEQDDDVPTIGSINSPGGRAENDISIKRNSRKPFFDHVPTVVIHYMPNKRPFIKQPTSIIASKLYTSHYDRTCRTRQKAKFRQDKILHSGFVNTTIPSNHEHIYHDQSVNMAFPPTQPHNEVQHALRREMGYFSDTAGSSGISNIPDRSLCYGMNSPSSSHWLGYGEGKPCLTRGTQGNQHIGRLPPFQAIWPTQSFKQESDAFPSHINTFSSSFVQNTVPDSANLINPVRGGLSNYSVTNRTLPGNHSQSSHYGMSRDCSSGLPYGMLSMANESLGADAFWYVTENTSDQQQNTYFSHHSRHASDAYGGVQEGGGSWYMLARGCSSTRWTIPPRSSQTVTSDSANDVGPTTD